jgi:hypothetical protein
VKVWLAVDRALFASNLFVVAVLCVLCDPVPTQWMRRFGSDLVVLEVMVPEGGLADALQRSQSSQISFSAIIWTPSQQSFFFIPLAQWW